MNAAKMRVRDRIHAVEPAPRQIAFRAFGLASKHFGIELNQSSPVFRNQIGVNVFGAVWHRFFCSIGFLNTIAYLPMSFWAERRISDLSWMSALEIKPRCFASLNMTLILELLILVYADECSWDRVEMLLSRSADRILPRRFLSNRTGRHWAAYRLR